MREYSGDRELNRKYFFIIEVPTRIGASYECESLRMIIKNVLHYLLMKNFNFLMDKCVIGLLSIFAPVWWCNYD